MKKQQLLDKLNTAWIDFTESYKGLTQAQLSIPGVTGEWSVKEIMAHITWWEAEALTHLPVIIVGGRPTTYMVKYGGIDAFNARMIELKSSLSLADVLREQAETHGRLVDYLHHVAEEHYIRETRFRRRLRLDTYGHYPIHTEVIRQWREQLSI